jgi:hypothetical protein
VMDRTSGRGGARVRHILSKRLFRCFDENADIVRANATFG